MAPERGIFGIDLGQGAQQGRGRSWPSTAEPRGVDRGLIGADAITALEAGAMEYILCMREPGSREVRAFGLEDDGAAVPLTIARQKGQTQLAVSAVAVADRPPFPCHAGAEGVCGQPGAGLVAADDGGPPDPLLDRSPGQPERPFRTAQRIGDGAR